MATGNRITSYWVLFFIGLSSSCAPVISLELKAKVDSSLTLRKVQQHLEAYEGKMVLWGGEIVRIIPRDGTIFIEVSGRTLGWREKPEGSLTSQGKFLILTEELLDFSLVRIGKKITVAGEIQGEISGEGTESLSEKQYRYPMLISREIHVWKDTFYSYSAPYRDPFYDGRGMGILRF